MKDKGCGEISEEDIGKELVLCGWIESIRDHGGVKFIDLWDSTGKVQIVLKGKEIDLGDWFVVRVRGVVSRRPKGTENPKLKTGKLEVIAEEINVLNTSKTLPFQLHGDLPDEFIRLKYRYIDLRREDRRRNIIVRHKISLEVRNFLISQEFVEIETPYLTKSTPEGARDFLVPSRIYPGKFYALPQSPQLLKQILQVAGFERYFQIVRCFRDEDLRSDRQPEFTQIDIEMSFITEEDIISLVENMLCEVFKKVLSVEIKIPFPKISYEKAIEDYGTDKPDMSIDIKMKNITRYFSNTELSFIREKIKEGGEVVSVEFEGIEVSKQKLISLEHMAKSMGLGGILWFIIKDGKVYASPIQKYIKEKFFEIKNGIVLAIAEKREKGREVLSKISKTFAKEIGLKKDGFHFVWVVDFPLFVWDEEEKRFVSNHHPFTAPHPDDIPLLKEDPGKVRARAYDIVLNGEEIGGGSIRISNPEMQKTVFDIINVPYEDFSFLLEALSFGAPPHGGIALGLDRLCALMLGEESIREVIAFPKTQSGICPLTGAPSEVKEKQLKELKIEIKQ